MKMDTTTNDSCVIAIGGDLGSGKSTVAKLVAERLGISRYSTGDMQRRMALSLGMTSLELNKLSETDPSIDQRIDGSTVEIASQEKRVVFDSRLAWHFVPQAFKMFLTVDPVIGAKRILDAKRGNVEQYDSLDEAIAQVTARRASEDKRFSEMYSVQMSRLSNYHLVADSSYVSPEVIAEKVIECVQKWERGEPFARCFLSPKTPFPATDWTNDAGEDDIILLRVDRHYFALSGFMSLDSGLQNNISLLPMNLLATDDEIVNPGETARQRATRQATPEVAHLWEETHGFRYPSYPPHFIERVAQP